jgi:23S rRNA pseudouridine2605 synthase
MTHPSVKIPKMYRVVVKGKMQQFDLDKMTEGIEIEPGKTAWADVRLLEYEDNKNTVIEVRLYQGLNRQIRKMTDYLGFPVISLKRISHGCLNLIGLKRGQYKKLRTSQVKELLTYIKKVERDLV